MNQEDPEVRLRSLEAGLPIHSILRTDDGFGGVLEVEISEIPFQSLNEGLTAT